MEYLYLKKIKLKDKDFMSKVKLISIIYAIGIIIGALFFEVWAAETSFTKTIGVFIWTIIFLIALFFADKNEKE